MTTDPSDLWSVADVATLAGVTAGTIRGYVSRGQMPAPAGRIGRAPYWDAATIRPWLATRPTTPAKRWTPNG